MCTSFYIYNSQVHLLQIQKIQLACNLNKEKMSVKISYSIIFLGYKYKIN